jgi:hypothetical protein
LPNGNTLITNSDSGQVFEITKSGEIVWEFYNPHLTDDKSFRVAIYRMNRLEFNTSVLLDRFRSQRAP